MDFDVVMFSHLNKIGFLPLNLWFSNGMPRLLQIRTSRYLHFMIINNSRQSTKRSERHPVAHIVDCERMRTKFRYSVSLPTRVNSTWGVDQNQYLGVQDLETHIQHHELYRRPVLLNSQRVTSPRAGVAQS